MKIQTDCLVYLFLKNLLKRLACSAIFMAQLYQWVRIQFGDRNWRNHRCPNVRIVGEKWKKIFFAKTIDAKSATYVRWQACFEVILSNGSAVHLFCLWDSAKTREGRTEQTITMCIIYLLANKCCIMTRVWQWDSIECRRGDCRSEESMASCLHCLDPGILYKVFICRLCS